MPIYEYRCPNGHLFELFQRIDDPPPAACEVCNAGPVEKVLHPVPIFFKGKGFYSTDYGKGSRRREPADAEKAKTGDGDKKPAEKTEAKKAEPA